MSKPAHNDVLKWGYENYLIDNRDFRRGFIEVNLADFAEVVYSAGFEAGKKEACADIAKCLNDTCDDTRGGAE